MSCLSKTQQMWIKRISLYVFLLERNGLGKNFAVPEEQRAEGNALLDFALNDILRAQYFLGGVVEFLECEDKKPLTKFHLSNGFKLFNFRITNDGLKLYQLVKFI